MATAGDEGRPSRRQPSSTRHSSMQRVKPRTRASNQSLQSAGRPQETTFTSFEPFSPPANTNGTSSQNPGTTHLAHREKMANRLSDSASIASYSSSKRSRSIYAPHRQNSVAELDDAADSQYGDGDEPPYSSGISTSGVSIASRSLHAVLMDQGEQSRPALFPDNLNAYRSNPQALADMSSEELKLFIYREGGAEHVLKTLAQDLAEKDAEVAMLRKRNDKFAFLFKEHLTSVHQMSRLDADKKVQSHFPAAGESAPTYSEELRESIAEALDDDTFGAQHMFTTPSQDSAISVGPGDARSASSFISRSRSVKSVLQDSLPKQPSALRRQIATEQSVSSPTASISNRRSGFWGVFGGSTSRSIKEPANKRNSIAGILGAPVTNASSQSLRSPAPIEAPPKLPPLEMEQKIDEGDLPPPLLSMQQLVVLFPISIFDNYGFVIDQSRVHSYIQYWTAKNNLPMENYRRILSSPTTKGTKSRAQSIISVETHDAELSDTLDTLLSPDDSPVDNSEATSKSWYDYLAFGGTLGLLSRMPAQPQAAANQRRNSSASDSDSEDEEDADARRCEDIVDEADYLKLSIKLRDDISKEYTHLQQDRGRAWARLLNTMAGNGSAPVAKNNRITRLLVNPIGTNGQTQQGSDFFASTIGIASLASSQYQDQFIKFVLGGIPMNLRSKIWLENAESSIHYGPEAFEGYKDDFKASIKHLGSISHDIDADKTRTLTNNIWFRGDVAQLHKSTSSQQELSSILRAFAMRNPHIGYVQGFNLIAGYLMLAMPTTEQAFWVFCFLIETVLPSEYFAEGDNSFKGPRADTVVLRQYIRTLMPRLAAHMDNLDLPDEQTVPINWLLTAFASTLSVEALFRVWDVVLSIPAQGTYLLRVALALLKINEEKLLRTQSASALYQVLDRHMGAGVSIDGLVHASWVLGKTFTAAQVQKRRDAAKAGL